MPRFALFLLYLCGVTCAADPEPFDFLHVYALPAGTAALQSLPSESVHSKAGLAAIAGEHAALRFSDGRMPALIIRFPIGGTPTGMPRLYRLHVEDGQRLAPLGRWAYSSAERQEPGAIPLRLERYGKVSYRLVPPMALRPGEYAISTAMGSDAYTFGIDKM